MSLEQGRTEIAERLLCAHGRIDSHKLRRGHLVAEDTEKIMQTNDELCKAPMVIDDAPLQNMFRISANARRQWNKNGIKLIVVDYLQMVLSDATRSNRQEQVADISRRLKGLARELKVPIIALCQVSRASEDRTDKKQRLSDLRESGAIEADADTVMLLHRPDYYEPGQNEGVVEVNVAKQRNGPTGIATLMFVKQYMRFENFAVEHSSRFDGGNA